MAISSPTRRGHFAASSCASRSGVRKLDCERVERAVALSVGRYCSVLSTIREAASITYTTSVEEAPIDADPAGVATALPDGGPVPV